MQRQREEQKRKAAAEEYDGLCDPASLEIIETWFALGGSQNPPSLHELSLLPASLLQDVRYFFRVLSDEREEQKRKRPKKPKRPRGKHR